MIKTIKEDISYIFNEFFIYNFSWFFPLFNQLFNFTYKKSHPMFLLSKQNCGCCRLLVPARYFLIPHLSTQKCLISILHFFHFESIYFDCYLFQNFRIRTLLPVRDVKKSVDFWNRCKTKQSNQSAVSLVSSIQKSIPVENSWSVTRSGFLSWIWRFFWLRVLI